MIRRAALGAILLAVAGCEGGPQPMPVRQPPPPPMAAYGSNGPGGASPYPDPPPLPVYGADQALRDALGTPLSLVGIGEWTGYFRHLSCIYRNAQVFVVDVRCNEHETYQFEAVVDSPERGRVQFVSFVSPCPEAVAAFPAWSSFSGNIHFRG